MFAELLLEKVVILKDPALIIKYEQHAFNAKTKYVQNHCLWCEILLKYF